MADASYVIRRTDGKWYAGTQDRSAKWTTDRNAAAIFPTQAAATLRCAGLPGRHYSVIPL